MQTTQPDTEFLLVDDDPSISEFLATYLSRRGHPSNATMEAEKALDWLSEKRCEVVVVDLNLPNTNGISIPDYRSWFSPRTVVMRRKCERQCVPAPTDT